MITEKTYKALCIVRDCPNVRAKGFARLMWPDSPAQNRSSNGGNGNQQGKGLWLSAGSYLAKLKKRGLVGRGEDTWSHILTEKGREAITEYEKSNQQQYENLN